MKRKQPLFEEPTVALCTRIPKSLIERVAVHAITTGTTRQQFIFEAVAEHLERERKGKKS